MPRVLLTLLGGFRAQTEPGRAAPPLPRKAQALLAYLALPAAQAHPRDKLAALLWGDTPEEQARNSLRQALFALRHTLPPGALRRDGDTLALDPTAVEVDVAEFERRVAETTPTALAGATALYQGDLLAGLTINEPPFEEWLLGERERLRELALEALAQLLAYQRQTGTLEAALQTGLRLLALDPLQEPVYRTVMRLYAQLGRRGAALRQYQVCVGLLQRELGVGPEAETKQLYQEILRERVARPTEVSGLAAIPVEPPETPLIGREVPLAQLRDALAAAAQAQGRVVTILGETGIGKSRLVAELAAHAVHQGARLLIGRANESEQILPFGPWVDALRGGHLDRAVDVLESLPEAWRSELARLLPDVGVAPPTPADYLQIFEAITQLVARLSARQPLVLVLEDLHWADEMTCRLLAFLGRRLGSWRVLIVATAREEEVVDAPALQRALHDLGRAPAFQSLVLPPLSQPETVVLVRALFPSGSAAAVVELAKRIWETSEGNPFTAVETFRALRDGAEPRTAGGLLLPERVWDVVVRRLARLSERGQELATIAAVIGREFEFTLLAQAARLEDTAAAEGVEELVRRRILHGVGEHFAFTHDQIREVAYAQLLHPRRKLLHRQVAEALEAVYGGRLEPHYAELGRHNREAATWDKAVAYLRQAGHQALARAAHREAAASFEQAIAALEHLPQGRAEAELAIDLRIDIRDALFPLRDRMRILGQLLEAEAIARRIDDRQRLGVILTAVCAERWLRGRHREALEAGRAALGLAGDIARVDLEAMASFRVGQALHALGAYPQARQALEDAVRKLPAHLRHMGFRGSGPAPLYVFVSIWLCWTLGDLGEFGEAERWGREALEVAEVSGHSYTVAPACFGLGWVQLRRGDLESAAAVLERGRDVSEASEFWLLGAINAAELGYTSYLAGRTGEAQRLLQEAVDRATEISALFRHSLWLGWLAEAELAAGHAGRAGEHAQEALRCAREREERGVEAEVLRVIGEIGRRVDPEQPGEAERHYLASLALAEELGMRPLVAHCHLSLGVLRHTTGCRADARSALERAGALYREMDMPFWLTRVEAELARLG